MNNLNEAVKPHPDDKPIPHTGAAARHWTPPALVMAPRTHRKLAGLTTVDGHWLTPPDYLVSNFGSGGPLVTDGINSTLPWLPTTSVPVNETQGTASNASSIFLGDFREMLIGMRLEIRIEVLRERYADNFQYGFLAYLRADVALARPAAFGRLIGIIP